METRESIHQKIMFIYNLSLLTGEAAEALRVPEDIRLDVVQAFNKLVDMGFPRDLAEKVTSEAKGDLKEALEAALAYANTGLVLCSEALHDPRMRPPRKQLLSCWFSGV